MFDYRALTNSRETLPGVYQTQTPWACFGSMKTRWKAAAAQIFQPSTEDRRSHYIRHATNTPHEEARKTEEEKPRRLFASVMTRTCGIWTDGFNPIHPRVRTSLYSFQILSTNIPYVFRQFNCDGVSHFNPGVKPRSRWHFGVRLEHSWILPRFDVGSCCSIK